VNLRAEHGNGTIDRSALTFSVEMDVLKMYSFCCSLGVVTVGTIQNFVLWLIIDMPLTLRRLMSYIYGAPILDVSRSHTTTQHSR